MECSNFNLFSNKSQGADEEIFEFWDLTCGVFDDNKTFLAMFEVLMVKILNTDDIEKPEIEKIVD